MNGTAPNPIQLPPLLKARCRYPRMLGSTGTVLILDANYFIQRECLRGFIRNGWKTVSVPVQPPERFIERFLTALVVHKPDLLFTVNHLGFDKTGVLTRLLEEIEMPYVSWFVDTPSFILLDHTANRSEMAVTPVWERSLIPELKGFGFKHAFHLPLAGDDGLFRNGKTRNQSQTKVAFVGDSMVAPSIEWRRRSPSFKGKRDTLVKAASLMRKDRTRNPMECVRQAADSMGISQPDWSARDKLNVSSAVVLEATRQYRWEAVANAGSAGVDIYGDNRWERNQAEGLRIHPAVDYYRDLPGVYGNSSVNLNLTSFQMPTAVNQRVFDVPLAGGFLLTDNQEDLELLFDTSREIAAFSDLNEMPEMVEFYLRMDHKRQKVSEAAAARVISNHTYRHRIRTIIDHVQQAFTVQNITVRVENPSRIERVSVK